MGKNDGSAEDEAQAFATATNVLSERKSEKQKTKNNLTHACHAIFQFRLPFFCSLLLNSVSREANYSFVPRQL